MKALADNLEEEQSKIWRVKIVNTDDKAILAIDAIVEFEINIMRNSSFTNEMAKHNYENKK